jgi:hypothetical protein
VVIEGQNLGVESGLEGLSWWPNPRGDEYLADNWGVWTVQVLTLITGMNIWPLPRLRPAARGFEDGLGTKTPGP